MTPDEFDDIAPPGRRRGRGTRAMLFAGVASACALGVGMGLWARPGPSERQVAATAALTSAPMKAAPAHRLQIVVDDRPAPAPTPIEVMPAAPSARSPHLQTPELQPELMAPKAPPAGLTRVDAAATPVAPLTAAKAQAAAQAARVAAAVRASAETLRKTQLAKAAAARVEARKVELARLEAARIQAHRVEVAQAEAKRAEAARESRLAAKAAARRIELARAAKAARAEQLRLARAEARGRAEARAEAKAQALAQARIDARRRLQLAAQMRARHRPAPHQPPPVQLVRLDRKPKPHEKVQRASLRRKTPNAAEPAYRARPAPLPHPGLMKVSTPRCASHDPGAAMVCADPSLGAAERQLARAYQGARAAGVPEAQLQRQQQRWLAARAAAAREAPWAVHDVYVARIAELNGQAHDARHDGY